MTIGLKIDADVKFDSLLMQVLDSCRCDCNLNAQIIAHELGGGSIGICCLYYTHLQTCRLIRLSKRTSGSMSQAQSSKEKRRLMPPPPIPPFMLA